MKAVFINRYGSNDVLEYGERPEPVPRADEVLIEVPDGKAEAARSGMQDIMCTPPAWAKDFPLRAECKVMQRYGKGK